MNFSEFSRRQKVHNQEETKESLQLPLSLCDPRAFSDDDLLQDSSTLPTPIPLDMPAEEVVSIAAAKGSSRLLWLGLAAMLAFADALGRLGADLLSLALRVYEQDLRVMSSSLLGRQGRALMNYCGALVWSPRSERVI